MPCPPAGAPRTPASPPPCAYNCFFSSFHPPFVRTLALHSSFLPPRQRPCRSPTHALPLTLDRHRAARVARYHGLPQIPFSRFFPPPAALLLRGAGPDTVLSLVTTMAARDRLQREQSRDGRWCAAAGALFSHSFSRQLSHSCVFRPWYSTFSAPATAMIPAGQACGSAAQRAAPNNQAGGGSNLAVEVGCTQLQCTATQTTSHTFLVLRKRGAMAPTSAIEATSASGCPMSGRPPCSSVARQLSCRGDGCAKRAPFPRSPCSLTTVANPISH